MRPARRLFLACLTIAAAVACKDGGTAAPNGRDGGLIAAKPAPRDPSQPPAFEPPTSAECDSALATLKKVVPDGVVGDAVDQKYCMQMPRKAVQCLAGVTSEAEADACLVGYATASGAATPGAPERPVAAPDEVRATEEQCRKALENIRRLVPDMNGDTEEMVKQCAGSEPADNVACLAAAKTTQELDACTGNEE